jgi:hypothetical protein
MARSGTPHTVVTPAVKGVMYVRDDTVSVV